MLLTMVTIGESLQRGVDSDQTVITARRRTNMGMVFDNLQARCDAPLCDAVNSPSSHILKEHAILAYMFGQY